jgi:DNA-binding MarR family transcriptional regulator
MTEASYTDTDRRRIIAEVLELGETLFDAALDAAAGCAMKDAEEPFPEKEMRTAADEFFRALRVLLRPEGEA